MGLFTIGSLFDGSGGFPLAANMCGGVPVWAAEVEPYPIAVTRSRFPTMKHLGDVSKINGAEIEPVDVVTFGSPCQDLSVAGKRAGLKHEDNGDEETTRSGLFMDAVRIIREMREATDGRYPTYAVWENVPGAFSSNGGEDFRTVLAELIKIVEPTAVMPAVPQKGWAYADCYIGDGWSLGYRVFDAQYWGVPQRRRRIHLVLDLRGQRAGEVLFERKGLRGYFETGRTPWQGAAADAQSGIGAADCTGGCVAKPVAFDTYNMVPTGDVTVTLRAGSEYNYAPVFQPVVCMATQQGGAEIRMDDKAPTITAAAGMSGNNQPVVCYDARDNGDGQVVPTLTGDHENRVTDYTAVVCESIPIHDQATRHSGRRGDKSDGKGNGLGVGDVGDPMNTLTGGDRHAVCYAMQGFGDYKESEVGSGMKARDYKDATDLVVEDKPIVLDRAFYNQGVNAQYDPQLYTDGTCPTLVAKGPSAVCHKTNVRYIVRRLTPTECARLQGFPDRWGDIDLKDDFTEAEYAFWLDVRNTHAAINDKPVKEYSKAQMVKWYNGLRSDSSEYKMWGNGIALPPALYCMQGIADAFDKEV